MQAVSNWPDKKRAATGRKFAFTFCASAQQFVDQIIDYGLVRRLNRGRGRQIQRLLVVFVLFAGAKLFRRFGCQFILILVH